jgi:hypothetical protein
MPSAGSALANGGGSHSTRFLFSSSLQLETSGHNLKWSFRFFGGISYAEEEARSKKWETIRYSLMLGATIVAAVAAIIAALK